MRVITGGQTGVDEGALLGAERAGTQWQAILPRGGRREGPLVRPELGGSAPDWMLKGGTYGRPAVMLKSASYQTRTRYVVKVADAVLLIAPRLTPGTRLTKQLAEGAGKPCHWCHWETDQCISEAYDWLVRTRPLTLMVAGPRLSKWDIGQHVTENVVSLLLRWYVAGPDGEARPVVEAATQDRGAGDHPFVPHHKAGAHPVLRHAVEPVTPPAKLPTARLIRR